MSFTPTRGCTDRSFELVRQSLLQGDGLPFADALTAEHIQQAFDAEGISFGDADFDSGGASDDDGGIVYTMGVTLWAMLSQALFTDVQRACRAAVQRVAVYYALLGVEVSSTNTGALLSRSGESDRRRGSTSGRRRGRALRGGRSRRMALEGLPHDWSSTARRSRCPTRKRTRRNIRSPVPKPRGWDFRSCVPWH